MSNVTVSRLLTKNRRQWLPILALVFSWIVFGSRYLYFLLDNNLDLVALAMTPFLGPIYIILYFPDLLFTRLEVYLILNVLGLGLTLVALIRGCPGRVVRVLLFLGLLAILVLPVLYHYEPAVWTDSDYAVRVPTQPGLLTGVVKTAQVGAEVRTCKYNLLGWSVSQGALYGEEICGQRTRIWVYWPLSDKRIHTVQSVPDDVSREQVSRSNLEGVHSILPLDESLISTVCEPVLISPEGWWYAFIARHVYGPEDVIIVSTKPRGF